MDPHPHAPHGAASAAPGASAAPAAGTQYTCPMHPQIVRDAPGTCPICGMALEPLMPSLEEDENPELRDFARRFWSTLPLSVAVLVLAMFGHGWTWLEPGVRTWVEFALATPVVLWAGWPFFVRGVTSACAGALTGAPWHWAIRR